MVDDNGGGAAYRYSWDVFLSFRGEDTRHGLIANLYDELVRHGVRAFRDDEGMERGDEIAPTLLAAIDDSAAAIVVISENYANSKWCLEELAKISESRKLMIPVFHDVNPSDVRRQKGSFEADFRKHELEVEPVKVKRWRDAMIRAGNISGLSSASASSSQEQSNLIKILVKKVLKELNNTPLGVAKYAVGLDSKLEIFLRKLDVRVSDVRIIGFYGMGGIGKTTLAKALYNKLIVHFKKRSFISSVREESQKPKGLISLQGKLIASLNSSSQEISDAGRGILHIKGITHQEPILLVLDDVDSPEQLDALAGGKDWFHNGTRIIITTRDKGILLTKFVDESYEFQVMNRDESVQLFSYHAFGREQPTQTFMEITKKIVSQCGGLPLALEVLGSVLFYKRRIKEWYDVFEKIQSVHPAPLQKILEVSYESLDAQEKCVFLDLACFFVSMKMKREEAIDIIKGCGFNAETIITDFTAKSLVKVIDNNVLWMHDQLRDMGREIVRRESYTDIGRRSRLWDQDEILRVLRNGKGTRSIEGITVDLIKKHRLTAEIPSPVKSQSWVRVDYLSKLYNRHIDKNEEIDDETLCIKDFQPMLNLRLLQINNAKLEGNFNCLPAELKWFQWKGCLLKSLPFEFPIQDLGVLDLSQSYITHLWSQSWWNSHSPKMAKKLLVVNLSACHDLEEIPDLSGLKCLEKLILENCSALVNIHKSIGDMSKLTYLNLRRCKSLVKFPSDVSGLKSLNTLILSDCTSLRHLPEDMSGLISLRELLLDHTDIVKLPTSIFRLMNLEVLNLNNCASLKSLPVEVGNLKSLIELSLTGSALCQVPESIGQLSSLEKLSLGWCNSLTSLPDSIGYLKSLTALFLNSSPITKLPDSIGSLCNLKLLSLSKCAGLSVLPDSIGGLSSLVSLQLEGTRIAEIPHQIGDLIMLEMLDLGNCQSLGHVPESVGNLINLKELFLNGLLVSELPKSLSRLGQLVNLKLNNCKNLQKLPDSIGDLKSLRYLYMDESGVKELPSSLGTLSDLRILRMRKEAELGTHAEAVVIPSSFSQLSMLENLDTHGYNISSIDFDDCERLLSLTTLDLSHNTITSLPSSLRQLSVLENLLLPHSKELKSLPPLPGSLLRLIVANCCSLEHLPDVSNLVSLVELELTNCKRVTDIPGLENLKSLRRLYTGGCRDCVSSLTRKLSKVALRHLNYLCIPGGNIPEWFVKDVVNVSCPRNRGLKGIVIGVVVSLEQQGQEHDEFRNKLPSIVDVQVEITRRGKAVLTSVLNLRGVPNTDEEQLYLCQFHDYNQLLLVLEDGDMLRVKTRVPPLFHGFSLRKNGIHVVYENDDDLKNCNEELITDVSQQSVSKRLSDFFKSLSSP